MEGRTTELLRSMNDLSSQVKSLTASFQKHFSGEIGREDLLQWIDAVFNDHEYERALVARVQGTCEWILQRPEFQEWMALAPHSSSASILWISGYPGFGKTILAAWLTEYLRFTKHEELSYFFCYFGDEKLRQPLNIVRSWISQLIKTNDKALEIVREMYTGKYHKALNPENITHATELELWLLFKQLNVGLGSLVFMIDGFDECVKDESDPRNHTLLDARERFLKALEESIEHTNARILIISRESADLRSRYRKSLHSRKSSLPLWLVYRITREDTQNDIGLYTRAIVNDVLHKRTNDLKDDIVVRLVEKCDGMFLYLRRIHPRLKSKSTMSAGKLRSIIENMPRGLDEAYERDLQAICDLDSEDRERALSILRWVLYAGRPLPVRELAEALLISADDEESLDKWLPQDDLPEAWDEEYTDEQIMGVCGSLIDIRDGKAGCSIENRTVHFVHSSVKEYLLKTEGTELPHLVTDYVTDKCRAQELITKTCLRYLCLKDFQQKAHSEMARSTITQFDARAEKYHFLLYAGIYLSTHLYQAQPWSQCVVNLCNALVDPSESRWLTFSEVYGAWFAGKNFGLLVEDPESRVISPLCFASLHGMYDTIKYLLSCGMDVNATGGPGGTPLQAATFYGHADSVKLLLEHGADVDRNSQSHFGNALQIAAANGHEGIVNILLDHGANPKINAGNMGNCVTAASSSPGRNVLESTACRIIERLIKAGAEIEIVDGNGRVPLHDAAGVGSSAIVETLLMHGADINASDRDGYTPLHIAIRYGEDKVVRSLLEYRAVPNPLAELECAPLIVGAIVRRSSASEFLNVHGAHTDGHHHEGGRPLHRAANSENLESSRALPRHGASVSQATIWGETALHAATFSGDLTSVKTLLAAGADVTPRDHLARTALCLSITQSHAEITKVLIEAGADPNILDYHGRDCFDWAASLRLDVPLLQATVPKLKHPSAVMDMYHQGMLYALGKPNRFFDTQDIRIRPEASLIKARLLGHLLLSQHRKEDACTALERDVQRVGGQGLRNRILLRCDLCDVQVPREGEVDGVYFVCTTCTNVDLCPTCMEEYKIIRKIDRDELELCESHEFLKVPSDGWRDLPPGKVNKQGETEEEWLARLVIELEVDH